MFFSRIKSIICCILEYGLYFDRMESSKFLCEIESIPVFENTGIRKQSIKALCVCGIHMGKLIKIGETKFHYTVPLKRLI